MTNGKSTTGQDLARAVYAAALHEGTSLLPQAVSAELASIAARQGPTDVTELDVEALASALDSEFAFLHPVVSNDRSLPEPQLRQWEAAVRALLAGLKAWNSGLPHAQDQLRALLTGIYVLDVRGAGLSSAAAALSSATLATALQQLVSGVELEPASIAMRRYPGLQNELRAASEQGNYERLGHYLTNLFPEPQIDLFGGLSLLWELDRAAALKAIGDKKDVLFYMTALLILDNELAELATLAPSDAFRFVAVDYLQHAANNKRPGADWEQVMHDVLVAAAGGPNWDGWTQALFKYFDQRSLPGRALGKVLASLTEDKWEPVIKAFAHGYTGRMAQAVADTLSEFAQLAGPEKSAALWKLAYLHWDALDYRREEPKYHMFSPMPTSLDFPVSMYYSQMPSEELDSEESRLVEQLAGVEQKRYESASDLITDRNRLLSRLRLVRHGRSLAQGNASGLPRAVEPEPDRYSQIRYHYHDYVARMLG